MTLRSLVAVAAAALSFLAFDVRAGYTQKQDFRPPNAAEKALTSVDFAPGSAAAILDWVRVDDDVNSFSSEYMRIKILSEEGKKYGDVEITYFPGYPYHGRVTDISARTIRPDGTVVPFDGKIYDKVVLKVGRRAVRAKTFSLPDVQPGSILEYRFTRRWSEFLLVNTSWTVQYEVPLLHAFLILRPYPGNGEFSSFFTHMGLPAGKLPTRVYDRFELELENVKPYQEESFAPPERVLKGNVNFYYTSSRVKPEQFWDVEPKNITKRVEDFLGRSGPAKDLARTLVGADPAATVEKIYAYVQTFRNYSFEPERTEKEMKADAIVAAKNVGDVLTRKAGTQEEINRAFVALARAAGLEADVVRVAPRDEFFFSKALPDPDQMSSEIAMVYLGGQATFLDPGIPHAPLGTISWEKANVPGIRASKSSGPQWTMVPAARPEASVRKRVASLKIDGETLTGSVVVTYTGQEALSRRLRVFGDSEKDRTETLEDEAKGWFSAGAGARLTALTGAASFAEPLVATFEVSVPNVVSSAGSRTLVPLSVFESSARNPFAATTRTNAIYYHYPRADEDEVTLTLPESLKVSALPPREVFDAGSMGYTSEAAANGQTVTYKRRMFTNVMLIDAKNYHLLRKFYASVADTDQEPAVLVAKD